MSALKDFLLANADVSNIEQEIFVSSRFKDEKGKILKFKIKPMTGDEFGEYQKKATTITVSGRQKETKFDSGKFNMMCVVNQCIEPSFKEADFLKQLGVQTPEAAVTKVLLAGEIVELGNQISKLSGFDIDINEEVENAKN